MTTETTQPKVERSHRTASETFMGLARLHRNLGNIKKAEAWERSAQDAQQQERKTETNQTERGHLVTPEQKAYEIWRTNGHSENVMIYILTDLLATIEQLRKG